MRTSAGLSNIGFANLTIDGNSETGSGQDGIQIRDVDGVSIHGVHFRNFSGTHLVLTNSGTAGNPCENVNVTACHFEGGAGDQLLLEDVDGVHVISCHFENPTTKGIHGDPDASASFMRSILIQGCSISSANKAIRIVGASGTANNNWRLVRIIGNEVVSDASTAITCGIASGIVKESIVLDNVLLSLTGDGIRMCAETGLVSRNVAPSSGGDGADISGSSDVSVLSNDFHDAGVIGVDLSDTTDCTVVGNNLSGATTSALSTTSAAGQHISSNIGALAPTVKTAYGAAPDETTPAAASGTYSESVTIPAGTVTVGSVIRVRAHTVHSGTGDDSTFFVSLGGEDAQAVTVSSANDANGDWVFVVKSLSGTGSTAGSLQGVAEASTNVVFCANSTLDVDWTADVAVEIKWTKSNTGNGLLLNTFSVEINGG
jgi:parallel beta-helix repeat protein